MAFANKKILEFPDAKIFKFLLAIHYIFFSQRRKDTKWEKGRGGGGEKEGGGIYCRGGNCEEAVIQILGDFCRGDLLGAKQGFVPVQVEEEEGKL